MPRKVKFDSEDYESYGGRKVIIVLCIDTSNSMYSQQKEINTAVNAFMEELDNDAKSRYGTEIAVITYDTTPRIHSPFTYNKKSIPPITIPANNPSGGWTDMGAALEMAIDLATSEYVRVKKTQMVYLPWIVFFTDGQPENRERNAREKMDRAIVQLQKWEVPKQRTDKIHFIGIGLGDNVDTQLMRRISSHGAARYLHANNLSVLPKIFKFVGATTVKTNDIRVNYDREDELAFYHKPQKSIVDANTDNVPAASLVSPLASSMIQQPRNYISHVESNNFSNPYNFRGEIRIDESDNQGGNNVNDLFGYSKRHEPQNYGFDGNNAPNSSEAQTPSYDNNNPDTNYDSYEPEQESIIDNLDELFMEFNRREKENASWFS